MMCDTMGDSEQKKEFQRLSEEIRQFLDQKIGKEFYCQLAFHVNTENNTTNIHLMQVTNMNFSKTPFNLVKNVMLTFRNGFEATFNNLFGIRPFQKPPEDKDYQ